MRTVLWLVVTLAFTACDPEVQHDAGQDAGQDADTDDDGDGDMDFTIEPPEPPAPPELPLPPVLTPCPPGWREVPPEDPTDPFDVAICDPWPEGGPQDCADDEAHFPGEPGCARIGTECPAEDWTHPPDDDERRTDQHWHD